MVKGVSARNHRPGLKYLLGHRFLSNQDYIESSILSFFFDYDKIAFALICLDTRYDQRVSGFILCEDAPKITFLTS